MAKVSMATFRPLSDLDFGKRNRMCHSLGDIRRAGKRHVAFAPSKLPTFMLSGCCAKMDVNA
jgi:hypothetical protein